MIVNLGTWAAHAAAVGWLAFVLAYGLLAPWWRSAIGRNVFTLGVVLACTFALVSVQLAFGVTWPAREWVRLTIFALVAATGWWRFALFLGDHVFRARRSTPGRLCRECGK
ncbi:MAG: hypothetical protein V4515_14480 [Chloroflexota bacterium]